MKKPLKYLATGFVLIAVLTAGWWFSIRPEQRITTVIKRLMSDPASVQLEDLQQSKRDPEVWCGRINARNRMGGMVGFKKFVISAPGFADTFSDAELVGLLSRVTLEDEDGFQSRRSLYCN